MEKQISLNFLRCLNDSQIDWSKGTLYKCEETILSGVSMAKRVPFKFSDCPVHVIAALTAGIAHIQSEQNDWVVAVAEITMVDTPSKSEKDNWVPFYTIYLSLRGAVDRSVRGTSIRHINDGEPLYGELQILFSWAYSQV